MSEIIQIDQDHREVVRGLVKDSSVICSDTSAPDVYVHIITKDDTAELFKGDGTVVPKMTRTRFHVFRKNPGDEPFSATVTVTDLPGAAAARADALVAAFSLVKHKPGALKAKKAAKKKVTKKAKKSAKKAAKKRG
ncbi:hypothetical protein JQ596_34320 [Bradyrhizobium manausense]|uniref:hypothetical protein n=1 Tax=Bradyrhizobium TaxID=374 RepID=UPI001BA7DA9F|nr:MULTISPECIES: hypothetical protein [Bradyrhizobium]MBR0830596.1 hypothetical protein [Bradyrhizobium manausense]UVO28178.1 hypothetical protein KUF59_37870 [Bradyrhizobium arachidis]